MKKKFIIILCGILITVISFVAVWQINIYIKIKYDKSINNLRDTDIIIALKHDGGGTYRFIFSDDNSLSVSYGESKYEHESYGNIISKNFMSRVDIEETILLPKDIRNEIWSLANETVIARATKEPVFSSDGWHLVAITVDGIYEIVCGTYDYDEKEEKLLELLSEWSPIVIKLGWTGGVAKIKEF